jgi:hypothetical protein
MVRGAVAAAPGLSSEHSAPSQSCTVLTRERSPSSSTVTALTQPIAVHAFEQPAAGTLTARMNTTGRTTSPHTLAMRPV